MPKKEKIPAPGGKKDEYTNFMSKSKWRAALMKSMLELPGRNLRPQGSKILANTLMKNKYVISMDLSGNHLGDQGAIEMAQALKVSELLSTLNLSNNDFTDVGAVALASAFVPCANPTGLPAQWNRSVNYLYLNCNEIGDDGFVALANAAAHQVDMKEIGLARNKIGGFGIRALYRSMEKNKFCDFILYGNPLGNEGVQHLCTAWKSFSQAGGRFALNLSNTQFSLGGGQALGELLDGNTTLANLNLSCNTLGSRGTHALANGMLSPGKNIVAYLDLRSNHLRDEGAEEVARIIEGNLLTLIRINVSDNEIEDKGGERLANALSRNSCVTNFAANDNPFGEKTASAMCRMIKATKSLVILDMKGNKFNAHAKEQIGDAVKLCEAGKNKTGEMAKSQLGMAGMRCDYGAIEEKFTATEFVERLTAYLAEVKAQEERKMASKKKKKKKRGGSSSRSSPSASARSAR